MSKYYITPKLRTQAVSEIMAHWQESYPHSKPTLQEFAELQFSNVWGKVSVFAKEKAPAFLKDLSITTPITIDPYAGHEPVWKGYLRKWGVGLLQMVFGILERGLERSMKKVRVDFRKNLIVIISAVGVSNSTAAQIIDEHILSHHKPE